MKNQTFREDEEKERIFTGVSSDFAGIRYS